MITLYSSTEACEKAGISFRQLDHWVWSDLITPYKQSKGGGTYRKFNLSNIKHLKLIKLMLEAGISTSIIKELNAFHAFGGIAKYLAITVEGETGSGSVFKVQSSHIILKDNPEDLLPYLTNGKVWHVVKIPQVDAS